MGDLKSFFREYGRDYLRCFGWLKSDQERKALSAAMRCRTNEYGHAIYRCHSCGERHVVYRSCGNRSCPFCQFRKGEEWLDKRLKKAIPCHHFMVTFTVPSESHSFFRSHPREGYDLLFRASSDTLKEFLSRNGTPGFFGVLHTWGRQLQYHPHIHFVVAGGALSSDGKRWHEGNPNFLAPVMAMSKVFRGKVRDGISRLELNAEIDMKAWSKGWNVNCQAVGAAEGSLKYLSAYVFRPGFSAGRFRVYKDGMVTFSYRKQGSRRPRSCTLKADDFLHRFLQHVLPKGFMKVRYYGFYSPNHGSNPEELRKFVSLCTGRPPPEPKDKKKTVPACPSCGGRVLLIRRVLPWKKAKCAIGRCNRIAVSMVQNE